MLVVAGSIFFLGKKLGLASPLKDSLESNDFVAVIVTFCIRFPLNFVWGAIVILLTISAALVFVYIVIKREADEVKVAKRVGHDLVEHWRVEVVVAIIMALLGPALF